MTSKAHSSDEAVAAWSRSINASSTSSREGALATASM
jgi:hypothetical protein